MRDCLTCDNCIWDDEGENIQGCYRTGWHITNEQHEDDCRFWEGEED